MAEAMGDGLNSLTRKLSTRSMTGAWVWRAVIVVLTLASRLYRSSRCRPSRLTPLGMWEMARLAREANPRYLTVVQVDRFYAGQV